MKAVATLLIVVSLGCAGTARVRTGSKTVPADDTTLAGIPFFPKNAVCKQETVWIEPIYVLTREKVDAASNKPSATQVKIARRSDLNNTSGGALAKLRELQEQFNAVAASGQITSDKFEKAWGDIKATGSLSLNPPSGDASDVMLASNSSISETYVDYSRPYYFNTRMPWIGSSTANATVAPDGSITNITATADNQTAKAVLDLLPISALLTASLGLTPDAPAATATASIEALDGSSSERATFRVETQLFQHTLVGRTAPAVSPCPIKSPIAFDTTNIRSYEYRWQPVVTAKPEIKPEDKKVDEKKPDEKKAGEKPG